MIVIVQEGRDAGRQIRLERGLLTIGRGLDNDMVLQEEAASRHHAELRRFGDGWLIVDVGSTNGTYLGGIRLAPNEARPLAPGESVTIGSTRLSLQVEPDDGAPGLRPAPPPDAWEAASAEPVPSPSALWGIAAWLSRIVVAAGCGTLIVGALQDWVQVQVRLPLLGTVVDRTFNGMDSGQSWLFLGVAAVALLLVVMDIASRRWGVAAGLGQALVGVLAAASIGLDVYRYYQLGTQAFLGISLLDIVTEYARDAIHFDLKPGVYLVGAGLATVILGGLLRLMVAALEPSKT